MTQPPTPSINRKELEAGIGVLLQGSTFACMPEECDGMSQDEYRAVVSTKLLQLFDQYAASYAREIIGEDDDAAGHTNLEILNHFASRNDLRAKQRAKLNQSNQEPQL